MAEIESTPGFSEADDTQAPGTRPGGRASIRRRSTLRTVWDALNEVVKSPVFVFFVGGSFIALLPRIEEWRLPPGERQAREQEQQARADAALVAPFLGNLNANEQVGFRASAAALKSLEAASRLAHDGHPSPVFEGVNAAIDAVARQLWPPPATSASVLVARGPDETPKGGPKEGPRATSPGYGGAVGALPPPPPPPVPVQTSPAQGNLSQACVYIQVARGDARKGELAAELKTTLDSQAILAPGIQVMSDKATPRQTQVRYFNDGDRGNAQALAAIVNGITHGAIDVAQLTLAARPGTLEVWFGRD